MKVVYPAVIHCEDGSYWAEFPDLEGCQSFGDSIAEVMKNAKEALAGYCITLIEQHRKLPSASDIGKIERDNSTILAIYRSKLK